MRILTKALSALLLASLHSPIAKAAEDKVLIVVSGEGQDQGKTRPGFEIDELSQAYLIFRANGLEVEIASPKGGPVEADKYNPQEPFNARLLADAAAMKQLAATRSTADLKAEDYAAIYIVGGKGAMFDLPRDTALKSLLADAYQRGAVIAAVCHGPAALKDVRLADGSLLVAGKQVTGFTNEEEALFGKRWRAEFPFLLEDALRADGARWTEAPLMMPWLAVDGRLITGQNPYSTTDVAEALVKALGRQPVARERYRDERTMALVGELLEGKSDAVTSRLAGARNDYHVELIGMLGYYQLQAAETDAAVRDALTVMQLAVPYMPMPELKLAIAQAHHRLGESAPARRLVQQLLDAKPDMQEAKQLLQEIDS
ncbi:DJ-1/PfpI family protein [Pseudomarimonas arenosa]|uniref:DJ-1/PfpI family protein n=1 Tax=Pseudomarimonas arenosa TaxID=2774145 RepID=A0AAW3ZK97_9GAMM|nr:DJ-1/PfpI family protein [Pseudomarimonas arenosa]MBD8526393.1 DJ-1/PfpI family protein [Pseudomarimonas arenosa]